MNNPFFQYLIEASVYLFFFLVIYKLLISKLTHFKWMRGYLLTSLILSVVLPILVIPSNWSQGVLSSSLISIPSLLLVFGENLPNTSEVINTNMQTGNQLNIWGIITIVLGLVWVSGASYKLFSFGRSLLKIRRQIRENISHKEGRFWIVKLMDGIPAFSFFSYIFINGDSKMLSKEEMQQIKDHEFLHAKQNHSLDTIAVELFSIVFWFNPLLRYLRNSVQEVHEYLADENISSNGASKKGYSKLLLGLTCEYKTCDLVSGFSGKQICKRVLMMAKARSANSYKLIFPLIIPLAAFLLLSFSYFDNNDSKKIGNIEWVGNEVYSDKQLNKALGLKKGDDYPEGGFGNYITMERPGIYGLYLDNGYLFFNPMITEEDTNKGDIDITIKIYEGMLTKIGDITIIGNEKVPTEDILKVLKFKKGDLFSRDKIMKSIRAIASMNKFDPEEIIPIPIPNNSKLTDEFAVADIRIEVTEK